MSDEKWDALLKAWAETLADMARRGAIPYSEWKRYAAACAVLADDAGRVLLGRRRSAKARAEARRMMLALIAAALSILREAPKRALTPALRKLIADAEREHYFRSPAPPRRRAAWRTEEVPRHGGMCRGDCLRKLEEHDLCLVLVPLCVYDLTSAPPPTPPSA